MASSACAHNMDLLRAYQAARALGVGRWEAMRLAFYYDAGRPAAAAAALEAWEWLSGTHTMIRRGVTYTAAERVAKAETCLATAVEWETVHPEGARRWASDELGADPRPRAHMLPVSNSSGCPRCARTIARAKELGVRLVVPCPDCGSLGQ